MRDLLRQDKFKAIWLSHSSLTDFLTCQRLYFLKNIYKNENKRKISLTSPSAVLGIVIHNVLEKLVAFKSAERVNQNLLEDFQREWKKLKWMTGLKEEVAEEKIKLRNLEAKGEGIMKSLMADFKILRNKTIAEQDFYQGSLVPNFYLNENENIILCGKLDWIEYDEQKKELIVIDFKTGEREEREDSRQLLIYKILLDNLQQKWKVSGLGKYWYLEKNKIQEKILDQNLLEKTKKEILEIGIAIREKRFKWQEGIGWVNLSKAEDNFQKTCQRNNCDCWRYEKILAGEGEYLGIDIYDKDLYKI